MNIPELLKTASKYFICDRANFKENHYGICFYLDLDFVQLKIDSTELGTIGVIGTRGSTLFCTVNEAGHSFEEVCSLLNNELRSIKQKIDNVLTGE